MVASASIAFYASKLVFSNLLVLNNLQATTWMDHGHVTVGNLLVSEVSQDLKDLLISCAKLLQFLCNNVVTLWVSLFLKNKDVVLALASKCTPQEKKLDLNKAKFLGSDLLCPQEKGFGC